MSRSARFVIYGLCVMYGAILLCVGGVSKPVATLFLGVGLIVASYGALTEKEPKAPAHAARDRPPVVRPRSGGHRK